MEALTEISDIVVCGNSDWMVNVVVSGFLVTGALPLTLKVTVYCVMIPLDC